MLILKVFAVLLFTLVCSLPLAAQTTGNWYRFTDAKSELTGYKDARGKVKIPPHYSGLTNTNVFKHIMAVTDDRTHQSYYLLKNGQHIGKDSLYVWDMAYDCEKEGKIRFRDPKTGCVGFFGMDGKVLIPAVYNDAQPFYNGLAVVLHNGKRICADGTAFDPKNPCEHWTWDGITALIDSKGNLVADSLSIDRLQNLNWYSRQIAHQPADTTLRISFKAKNGLYYTFIDYEKEFKQWFDQQFLNNRAPDFHKNTFNIICVEGIFKNRLRKFFSKKTFIATYRVSLLRKLQHIKTGKTETQILSEPLNNMIFTQPTFSRYSTDCGEAGSERYPLFDVIATVNDSQGKFLYQEHFFFLRTASGYQLIEVAWKNLR